MGNCLGLRYATSLINFHRKTQGFDVVYKSTVNLAFNILKPKNKNAENSTRYKK